MGSCTRYPDDDLRVRYVTGDLPEPEQSAFEDHMFACDACLGRVEWYQSAQGDLATRPVPASGRAVSDPAMGLARPSRGWVLTALAAIALLLLGGAFWLPRTSTRTGVQRAATTSDMPPAARDGAPSQRRSATALEVAVLAMVTPPPYLPTTRRRSEHPDPPAPSFKAGMDAYVRQDWPAASRALRDVQAPEAQFYRGVAELMRGDAAAAVEALEAARASGRQPYARESQFYLAKAALRTGDAAKAREWLTAAQRAEAGPPGEAARLLDALADLP